MGAFYSGSLMSGRLRGTSDTHSFRTCRIGLFSSFLVDGAAGVWKYSLRIADPFKIGGSGVNGGRTACITGIHSVALRNFPSRFRESAVRRCLVAPDSLLSGRVALVDISMGASILFMR